MQKLPRRTIFVFCCLGMAQVSFATAVPAVCLPAIAADMGMTAVEKSLFLSAAFWGLAVAILVTGLLADRWRLRALMVASGALQAGGLAIVSFAGSLPGVIAGGFVLGLGSGVADALLTPLVNALYPERRTTVTNLLNAFYPIGLIATICIVLAVLHMGLTWRGAFGLLSVAALPYGLAMLFLPLPGQLHEGTERLQARRVVRKGTFLLLMGAIFLAGVTELGPSSWLPDYVRQITSASMAQGGLGLILFGVAMAAGRLGTSVMIRRLGVRRLFVLSGTVCMVSLLLAAFSNGVMTVIWLSILGLGVAGLWPTILACTGNRFPQGGVSMYSLLSAAGSFGGVVGPIAIGQVAQWSNIRVAMAQLAVAPLLLMCIMLWLLRTKKANPKHQ